MKKSHIEIFDIDFKDIELQVAMRWYPAYRGAREGCLQLEPDEDAGYELEDILHKGESIIDLLSDSDINTIETIALEKASEQEQEPEEYYYED